MTEHAEHAKLENLRKSGAPAACFATVSYGPGIDAEHANNQAVFQLSTILQCLELEFHIGFIAKMFMT